MQSKNEAIASARFGTGAAPGQAAPNSPAALLQGLQMPEPRLGGEIPGLEARDALLVDQRKARKLRATDAAEAKVQEKKVTDRYRAIIMGDRRRLLARAIGGPSGLRERLAWFWADHFTVAADGRRRSLLAHDLVETAIRPNITGRFAKLLREVVQHPAMLVYLNQARSVGPNSPVGKRRNAGLNENLAREVLELHTLGVDAGYTQSDVREFAELLTGLSVEDGRFAFKPRLAEPGAENVLGAEYGGGKKARLRDVNKVLRDLAMRPQTARHLAAKLIRHFVTLTPDESYVEAVADAYLGSNGDLMATYAALVDDPRAWELPLQKAKTPIHFIVSSVRALGVTGQDVMGFKPRMLNTLAIAPMATMGQPLMRPIGPDGWSEDPTDWITPSGLAARVHWANSLVQTRGDDRDPRQFLDQTLGVLASPLLQRAVGGAETRHEGLTLVLASPEFNRC
ncbi:MAG: DUF1800 domain-containing protein [Pseudomonadota bacterium]